MAGPVLGNAVRKALDIRRTNTSPDFSGVNGQISHGSLTSLSGMKVSEEGALRIAAAWIANTLIADEVASLPYKLIRRGDATRTPVRPGELEPLWRQANPDQTQFGWISTLSLSLTLWGASYSMLGWNRAGQLDVIWPLDPSNVQLSRTDDGGLRLTSLGQGDLINRPGERPEFMMIPFYTLPGRIEPVSPVRYAAELLGLSAAYEATAARLMGRGLNPSAILTAGERVPPAIAKELAHQLEEAHGGPTKAGRIVVVGGKDLKLERLTMSMADAEFIAQKREVFNVVMALWRVPPTVAGMVDKPSTWGTGIAEFARGLERFTLRPIVQRLQAAFETSITRWVDPDLQVRFKFDSLLSASPRDRAEIQRLRLMSGMTSVERVLAEEDVPPFQPDETTFTQLAFATDEDRRLQRLRVQAETYSALVRAGVSPDAAATAAGFDPADLTHTGLRPVTVSPREDA